MSTYDDWKTATPPLHCDECGVEVDETEDEPTAAVVLCRDCAQETDEDTASRCPAVLHTSEPYGVVQCTLDGAHDGPHRAGPAGRVPPRVLGGPLALSRHLGDDGSWASEPAGLPGWVLARTPPGYSQVAPGVYEGPLHRDVDGYWGRWRVTLGTPDPDEAHDCDAMGCAQDHVVRRDWVDRGAPPLVLAWLPAVPADAWEPLWWALAYVSGTAAAVLLLGGSVILGVEAWRRWRA